ncbi:prepilin peptidase [Gorillibacterium timonense]|uniref:prepilin peptidase n=1 Tax=Gorillibacterium timonense TaxID=1689269 RepID=UPI00071D88F7|nr:A24 family peptidase [Gorillibacterium timonense]
MISDLLLSLLIGLLLGSLLTWLSDCFLESASPDFQRFVMKRLPLGWHESVAKTKWLVNSRSLMTGELKSLPRRYGSGILAFGVISAITYTIVGQERELLITALLLIILYLIVLTDLAEMIIPDEVVLFGAIAAVLLRLFLSNPLPLWNYAAAAIGGSVFLLVIGLTFEKLLGREAMGGGDIKLYGFLGLILGVKLTALSLFLASAVGLLVLLPLQLSTKKGTGEPVPFGPFIAIGAWIAYLWGDPMVNGYLHLLM